MTRRPEVPKSKLLQEQAMSLDILVVMQSSSFMEARGVQLLHSLDGTKHHPVFYTRPWVYPITCKGQN